MSAQKKFTQKTIVVLCGGKSAEAEVSLVSGRAVFAALQAQGYRAERVELTEDRLPQGLSAEHVVVFPAMHGGYGEGGNLQRDLDALGIHYAGSDAAASALCMDKAATKNRIGKGSGFHVARSVAFTTAKRHPAAMLWAALGKGETAETEANAAENDPRGSRDSAVAADAEVSGKKQDKAAVRAVLKPRSGGSSVGLFLLDSAEELQSVLETLPQGEWLLERRILGREMTIGVLGGTAQAIVEIVPEGGVYDFTRKYRGGSTQYLFPAPLPPALAAEIATSAERVCAACGCRDFARVDFILDESGRAFFLEVNTLPGLTPTSLLPKSASVGGLDFNALVERMLSPALARAGWSKPQVLKN